MRTTIEVQGARENNLKNISVELPRDQLIVVTGVSGSGKSSLAFDTIYAEGQRRLLASMSNFAKRFIGQLKKTGCGLCKWPFAGSLHRSKDHCLTLAFLLEYKDSKLFSKVVWRSGAK